MADHLPEGTDEIIAGASDTGRRTTDRLKGEAAAFKEQAADKARDYADIGKERASGALDSMAKLIGDGAGKVDDALGATYGDYVRRAAEQVSGFSGALREKDVDELVADARDLVRRSPAIAIGAAAAAGFVIARLIKAGSETLDQAAQDARPKAKDAATEVSASARKAPKRKPQADS